MNASSAARRWYILGIAAVAASMVACRPAAPDRTPEATRPLLTVERRGGLCPYGPCATTVEVVAGGAYRLVEGDGGETAGALAPGLVGALEDAIGRADFDAARTRGFTETCPTAYGGQEVIYTFHAAHGAERMSTCEYVIEWDREPFPQALAILDAVGR